MRDKKREIYKEREIKRERDKERDKYRGIKRERERDRAGNKNPKQSWVAQLVVNELWDQTYLKMNNLVWPWMWCPEFSNFSLVDVNVVRRTYLPNQIDSLNSICSFELAIFNLNSERQFKSSVECWTEMVFEEIAFIPTLFVILLVVKYVLFCFCLDLIFFVYISVDDSGTAWWRPGRSASTPGRTRTIRKTLRAGKVNRNRFRRARRVSTGAGTSKWRRAKPTPKLKRNRPPQDQSSGPRGSSSKRETRTSIQTSSNVNTTSPIVNTN